MIEADCVKVPLRLAEEAIKALRQQGLLAKARPRRSESELRIPVVDIADALKALSTRGLTAEPCRDFFEEGRSSAIPPEVGLSGFVKMGNIVMFSHARGQPFDAYVRAAEAVTKVYRDVESVFLKVGTVGELRLPQLVLLYGSGNTVTKVKENGLLFLVDVAKTYFNPKLATERLRVANDVSQGESVLDMFAGVGPFSITIAARSYVDVLSVDINPYAAYLAARNVELNRRKLKGRVQVLLADSSRLVDIIDGEFDRIIMNNPTSVLDFMGVACSLASKGAKLHVYVLSPSVKEAAEVTLMTAKRFCHEVKVMRAGRALEYSPSRSIYSVDLVVSR
ncbi:MAG: class I SAM-dependent methyltransferase [Acidilobus sp.]